MLAHINHVSNNILASWLWKYATPNQYYNTHRPYKVVCHGQLVILYRAVTQPFTVVLLWVTLWGYISPHTANYAHHSTQIPAQNCCIGKIGYKSSAGGYKLEWEVTKCYQGAKWNSLMQKQVAYQSMFQVLKTRGPCWNREQSVVNRESRITIHGHTRVAFHI